MIEKDFQRTHRLILQSALVLFEKNGYLDTNLRDISRDAGVTTGAIYQHFKNKADIYNQLVQPFIEKLKKSYLDIEKIYLMDIDHQSLRENWQQNSKQSLKLVDVVYDHFSIFRLLAFGAEGTQYEDLIEKMTAFSEIETQKYFTKVAQLKGMQLPDVDEDVLHLLIHAYLAAFVDVLKHDYGREAAKKKIQIIDHFFLLGWQDLYQF